MLQHKIHKTTTWHKSLLNILFIAIFIFASTAAYSRPVSGTITSNGKKLAKVVVSDGVNFAQTDSHGKYTLDIADNADFIFVVTPAGYAADFSSGSPAFYKKVNSQTDVYDFDLIKWGNKKRYTLIAVADPQPKTQEHFNRYEKDIFPDIRETAEDYCANEKNTVAGIYLGDICWDNPDLNKPMKKLTATAQIPFYPVIGNHDHDMTVNTNEHDAERRYRDDFGPTYYAFNLGKDYVIVLDNIVYHLHKKYDEAISQNQLVWLQKYLKNYVPKGSHLIIAMHAPFKKPHKTDKITLGGGENLMNICADYNVNILSGHTHRNNNTPVTPNFYENNLGTTNASLWLGGIHNNDGAPWGYKIFSSNGKDFTWYYKTVNKPSSSQMELFNRGQSLYHPSEIVAAIWDYDPKWTVTWSQDGTEMGAMKQVYDISPAFIREALNGTRKKAKDIQNSRANVITNWYFTASPSDKAKQVVVTAHNSFGDKFSDTINLNYYVEVQAHRGGAGLMPQNTIAAMKNAVDLGANTLELDLNVSKDNKIVVSHDPWMNHKFVTAPSEFRITKDNQKNFVLYAMPYDSIAKYDCGLKDDPDFPHQEKMAAYKPLLSDLIDSVEQYAARIKVSPLQYNIEIKSDPKRDNMYTPAVEQFCDLVMDILESKNLGNRLTVQSFDVRALNYLHQKYPQLQLSYNIHARNKNFEKNIAKLNFTPACYSPDFSIVDKELVDKCHNHGMKIVVWTLDKPADMQKMLDLKVDAIMSNYPNKLLKIQRGY